MRLPMRHRRFNRALSVAMDDESGDVSVVSHGTVIALYVSRATGFDPYRLWRRLGFPANVTLSWPSRRLLGLIDEVR